MQPLLGTDRPPRHIDTCTDTICCCDCGRNKCVFLLERPKLIALIVISLLLLVLIAPKTKICKDHAGASETAAVAILMGASWMFELLPVSVVALLPATFLPSLGAVEAKIVASHYFNDSVLLVLASSILAVAVQRYNLHRRLALAALVRYGRSPRRLLLTFMLVTAFLSMWLSNTSTTVLMAPIAINALRTAAGPVGGKGSVASGSVSRENGESSRRDRHANSSHSRSSSTFEESDGGVGGGLVGGAGVRMRRRGSGSGVVEEGSEAGVVGEKDDTTLSLDVSHTSPAFQTYAVCLLICIGYSATMGGMATLTGTGTNVLFGGTFSVMFPKGPTVTFFRWFAFGAPVSVALLTLCWVLCIVRFVPSSDDPAVANLTQSIERFREEYEKLGPMTKGDKIVLAHFVVAAMLWFFKEPGFMPGWASLFARPDYISDGTVGMVVSLSLFIIPKPHEDVERARARERVRNGNTNEEDEESELSAQSVSDERLLDETVLDDVPWPIMLLLGGGITLGFGFDETGLSSCVADSLYGLSGLPVVVLMFVVMLLATTLSEMMSNVATASVVIPIIASMAVAMRVNPLTLLVPGIMSCCLSFVLPISTTANAVMFATKALRTSDYVRHGSVLKALSLVVLAGLWLTIGRAVYGVSLSEFPEWAEGEKGG